ncbi:hypothetical protein BGW36DRAFT_195651 [Talaromyces proteolyticus]|uniref:Uncharacterized protein n=1 Tax=Talaromyces proteolyticus TaxID=1131652 RepID=A0AAD4PWF1_9EURO|nr:uncharacterized protein BGW36DRAFT_195651 [Talaromyces proteolyticus]KAH8695020.1 hypothetical protein BGW36DRAFT_195651 [Talaromyces proteolyticus]
MSAERFGEFNGINGQTASEAAQARTDAREAEIRRPAMKIDVISDEEWDRRVNAAEKRRKDRERAEEDEKARKRAYEDRMKLIEEQVKAFESRLNRDIDRDRRHRQWYEDFFNRYHEPDNEGEFSAETWKKTYQRVACFLAKLDGAYNWSESDDKSDLYMRLGTPENRTSRQEIGHIHNLATKKHNGKKLPFSQILVNALEDRVKHIAPFIPLSKKITHPADEDINHALGAVIHLVDDNNPKDLAAWKALMISGLDCKKHPKPPNMHWKLEETLNQKIDSMDEAKLLKKMISDPEFLPDYASLCARTELLNAIIGSESIRILLEDEADLE